MTAMAAVNASMQGIAFGPFTPQSRVIKLDVKSVSSGAVSLPGGTYVAYLVAPDVAVCRFNAEVTIPTPDLPANGFALGPGIAWLLVAPSGSSQLNVKLVSGNGTLWLSEVI